MIPVDLRPLEGALLSSAWSALVGAPGGPPADRLEIDGSGAALASRFPVAEAATASVATALLAAAALHEQRGGRVTRVGVDRAHVAAAVRSERYFRHGTESTGMGFAPLSRFWRSADGWVRTHANYPWHRAALLAVLGVRADADADAVAAAIATRPARTLEDEVFAAGGIAAAVRTLSEWQAHEQGRAVGAEPLISHAVVGPAPARIRPAGTAPADGIRVLDLTRVIAGPVCTRYLGALGADVLRLDPPGHLDMAAGHPADTLLGKRSALLDATSADGVALLHGLLEGADVLVAGYRPGALDRFGLAPADLAERHPGLVVVYLDAWGHTGPWAGRRGFDSVVQAPTGIADGEAPDRDAPGALPCQLLDHGTGYLAAAAVLDGVRRQTHEGGTHVRRLSLARTAAWLTAGPTGEAEVEADTVEDATRWRAELDDARGSVTAVRPPGAIGGRPIEWPERLTRYGEDPPSWSNGPPAG
jgi:crotonobetainyl-CoA:carnitine CoA-transferase CaiB-like acyl-CoA transferase